MDLVGLVKTRSRQVEQIFRTLDRIYEDLESNVVRIIGRREFLLVVDLTVHSVLSFKWRGVPLQRGYVQSWIGGDAGTGKSTVVERLIRFYGCGEIRTGENVSLAGLIGGIDKGPGQRNIVRWGLLPTLDGELLVIDEAHAVPEEVLSCLTSVRSSGVAEVTKIQGFRARARVRMIWVCNPVGAFNSIRSYGAGIRMLPDLIPRHEDIRRFDLACLCSKEDVSSTDIRKDFETGAAKPILDPDHCYRYIQWIWSRRPNDVVFDRGVQELCMDVGQELATIFNPAIPLFLVSEAGVKVARLAVALAARLVSTLDGKIRVQRVHVKAIREFILALYKGSTYQFDVISKSPLTDPNAVITRLRKYPDNVLMQLQSYPNVGRRYLEDLTDSKDEADALFRFLFKAGCLERKGTNRVQKREEFIQLLHGMISGNGTHPPATTPAPPPSPTPAVGQEPTPEMPASWGENF